jgi:hypothetical protein
MKRTLSILGLLLLPACGGVQLVAATDSTGDTFPYCLKATFKLNPFQAKTLFCAGLSEVQAEQQRQQALHPDVTYSIVEQKKVTQ